MATRELDDLAGKTSNYDASAYRSNVILLYTAGGENAPARGHWWLTDFEHAPEHCTRD
jgi:hypothetical protein